MTLAYVFWHRPRADVDGAAYAAALDAFHATLAADPSPGLQASWSSRLDRAPWADDRDGWFEDWYLVDDWTALGENVGIGYSLQQVESMFESSAPHQANLLNGAYNQVGVGVTHGSDGRIYVTQFFIAR